MTLECCFAKLSYLIGQGLPNDKIRKLMQTSIRGELTSIVKRDKKYSLKNFTLIKAISEVMNNDPEN